jgi:hypothetical protein
LITSGCGAQGWVIAVHSSGAISYIKKQQSVNWPDNFHVFTISYEFSKR